MYGKTEENSQFNDFLRNSDLKKISSQIDFEKNDNANKVTITFGHFKAPLFLKAYDSACHQDPAFFGHYNIVAAGNKITLTYKGDFYTGELLKHLKTAVDSLPEVSPTKIGKKVIHYFEYSGNKRTKIEHEDTDQFYQDHQGYAMSF